MQISQLELQPFEYEIKTRQVKRKGFICKWWDENGNLYLGEASPLFPYNQESLEEVKEQLKALLNHRIDPSKLYPCVHFAIHHPLDIQMLSLHPLKPQKTHGLLYGAKDQILLDAKALKDQKYTHVKLKIKDLSNEETKQVLKTLAPDFILRIDANQKYRFDEAIQLFFPFQEKIDYIEEPTFEIDKLEDFPLPFALDESLKQINLQPFKNLKALILRPTYLRFEPFLEFAKKWNLKVYFSTAWETGIGLAQLIQLHQEHSDENEAGAFDTLRWISDPTLQYPLSYHEDKIATSFSKVLESSCL